MRWLCVCKGGDVEDLHAGATLVAVKMGSAEYLKLLDETIIEIANNSDGLTGLSAVDERRESFEQ